MKQMNKEELIEYFIEQLGDNEILGPVMSIEQIREKLNYEIEDVKYNEEKEIFAASVDSNKEGKRIINFDLNKIPFWEEKTTIVHELLHVLSSVIIPDERGRDYHRDEKVGFLYRNLFLDDEERISRENCRFINEGMTDILAEKISGNRHNGYDDEKDIVKTLFLVIGEDIMLKKYFSEKGCDYHSSLDMFKDELEKKYGKEFGNNINDYIKKIIKLSDQLEELNINKHRLNDNGKKLRKETRDEIYSALENMVNNVIEHEENMNIKIQEILYSASGIFIEEKIKNKILKDIVGDTNLDIDSKVVFLEKVQQKYQIPEKLVQTLLLDSKESQNLSDQDKLNYYLRLEDGNPCIDLIYDLYKKCGRISEEVFNKKNVFERYLSYEEIKNLKDIESILKKQKYTQIGEYFKVGNLLYDIEGNEIKKNGYRGIEKSAQEICSKYGFDEMEYKKELQEQIGNIFFQNKMQLKDEELDERVIIADNLIILTSKTIGEEEKSINEYFYVSKEGCLKKIEPRSRKKIFR